MDFLDQRFAVSRRLIDRTDVTFRRFLVDRLDWRQPLLLIVGMRGAGKTTLLLQHLRTGHEHEPTRVLYLTADDIHLGGTRLVDVAERFALGFGGRLLVVDEIHRYPGWQQEIKNVHDLLPDLQLIATGSSSLDLARGAYDLSRRALVGELPQLSFREFLALDQGVEHGAVTLGDLLGHHADLSGAIVADLRDRGTTVLERFRAYLDAGAYPFFLGKRPFDFHQQVVGALQAVLYQDIPAAFGTAPQAAVTLQRLLNLVTTSEPYVPNIEGLARDLGIAKETAYHYLDYLERSHVLAPLPRARAGSPAVRKPAKIYLANPTLYAAVAGVKGLTVRLGTLRESFLLSHLSVDHRVTAHPKADFVVEHADGPVVIEVGGRGKGAPQLGGRDRGVLALDGIEHGLANRVPLWAFGFLY